MKVKHLIKYRIEINNKAKSWINFSFKHKNIKVRIDKPKTEYAKKLLGKYKIYINIGTKMILKERIN